MIKDEIQLGVGQTRRQFLNSVGIGVTAALAGATTIAGPRQAFAAEAARLAGPGRASGFQLGVASYTFRKFTLDEALSMTRRVGLQQICLKSFHLPLDSSEAEVDKVAAKVRKAGISLYGGGVIRMNDEAGVRRAFEYARAAGMKTIVGVPGPDVLPLVNRMVQRFDIAVAIHNHGPGDKTYPTPQSAYEKIKGLDQRIGLCIDVGHTIRVGADPIASAERYSDRLLDVHMKDVSAAEPQGKEIEVGRGVIDIPGLLKTLIKVNYTGVVAFEYEKDAGDPLAGLAESVGFVRGVLAAV